MGGGWLIGMALGCAGIERFDVPIEPQDPWQRGEPEPAVLERIEAAQAYSESHGGRSLMVLEGDTVLYQSFYNGHAADTPWPFWSGTKTFSCVLASRGIDEGWLRLDERVADTIDAWSGVEHKQDVTVEHLLRFTSGLQNSWLNLSLDGFRSADRQRVEDKYAYALDQPSVHAPGTVWEYGNVHLTVFGALLEAKLAESPLAWLQREVFAPLGFRTSGWNLDPDGNPMLGFGAWTSTGELSKFGALLRDDGLYQGERILPEGTLARCMQPGALNPAYGLATWLNEEMGEGVDFDSGGLLPHGEGTILGGGPDMLVAAGARGQRVYVIPSLDWVVVHQCDSNRFEDPAFMEQLLGL